MLGISCESFQSTVRHNLNVHQTAAKFVLSQVMRSGLMGDRETHNSPPFKKNNGTYFLSFKECASQNASNRAQSVCFLYEVERDYFEWYNADYRVSPVM